MPNILDLIVSDTKAVIEHRQQLRPLSKLKQLKPSHEPVSLVKKLVEHHPHIIAEFKRKSPSKPNINLEADPIETALRYERGGASAISVLTEPLYFGGSPEDLVQVRKHVALPLLRKDFLIDPYQIFEARFLGADLVLLIAKILNQHQLKEYCQLAHDLGMEVLCEIHELAELETINGAPIDLLGVNCRNLQRFETNIENFATLASQLPKHTPWVAESGINNPQDLRQVYQSGYQLFLIGEHLMAHPQPEKRLKEFRTYDSN